VIAALVPTTPGHAQATIRVPADQPTIQAAIDAAAAGDTVLVAPGTYAPINFKGKALTVESGQGPAFTIIDGGSSAPGVVFAGGEGPGSVLRGFTVQHGRANGSPTYSGGGVQILGGASPLVTGNVITANSACGGNGIYVSGGSPTIQGNWITGNSVYGCSGYVPGGGIDIGGSQSAQIIGNLIAGNSTFFGGGIHLNAASATIRGNVITANHADYDGGGIALLNASAAVIVDNLIADNVAVGNGGGINSSVSSGTTPAVIGNTLVHNQASDGSAIWAGLYDSGLQIADNVVVGYPGNVAAVTCDATYQQSPPVFTANDVVADQTAYKGTCASETGTNGNISVDPLLRAAASGDDRLATGSPAIDQGVARSELTATDLDGNPRVVGGRVDMGAYEWSPSASTIPTAVTLTSDTPANVPPGVGAIVHYAAAVAPAAGGAPVINGTVDISVDGAPATGCTGLSLAGGPARCAVHFDSIGTHTVAAAYSGAGSVAPSSASTSQTAGQGATTTTLRASNNPGGAGQQVTLTATVSVGAYQGSIDGAVSFTSDGATIGGCASQPLTGAVATCVVTYPASGSHDVLASYAGTGQFAASTSAPLHEQVGSPTVTAISDSAQPSVSGQQVTYTASVGPAGQASGTPTGSVAFTDGGAPIAGCASVPLTTLSAACTTGYPGPGSHPITATYGGDATFGSSTSPTPTHSVAPAPTAVSVPTASLNPAAIGSAVVLGARVSVVTPGAGTPTGSITFEDGGSSLGTSPVDGSGVASFTTSTLGAGSHVITAVYGGDASLASSGSAALHETVLPVASTTIDLRTSTYPSAPGQPVWLTISVGGGDVVPTGVVRLTVNGQPVSGGGLFGGYELGPKGTAYMEILGLINGDNRIDVDYMGDHLHNSSRATWVQTVAPASPDRRFVNQVYNDVLLRSADSAALGWVTALDQRRIDRTHVALAFTSSTEYLTDRVQDAYLAHLGRYADPAGLSYWIGIIRGGGTFEQLDVSFLGSPEYFAGAGGTADAFLDALYWDVFGRAVDGSGRRYWDQRLASGTPQWQVAMAMVLSYEAMSNRVIDDYWWLLGRPPDSAGLAYWTGALQHGIRDEQLFAFLIGSDEYWAFTQS
jgi:hypothetical protein